MDRKIYTKEELDALPQEELIEIYLKAQDEYQRLEAKREQVLEKLQKTVQSFRIMQSCPQLRQKIQRNAPCPCGSGLKYKKCCIKYESEHLTYDEAMEKLKEAGLMDYQPQV